MVKADWSNLIDMRMIFTYVILSILTSNRKITRTFAFNCLVREKQNDNKKKKGRKLIVTKSKEVNERGENGK